MKKINMILVMGVILTFMACGSGSTTSETTDSSVTSVDTATQVTDSTVTPSVGGGGGTVDGTSEKPTNGGIMK